MTALSKDKITAVAGKKSFAYILFSIAAFALYFHICFFSLTGSDDKLLLSKYSSPKETVSGIFGTPYMFSDGLFYRPIVSLTFYLTALISNEIMLHYFFNILLHIIAGFLLYNLMLLLKISSSRSFILTLLFCVHPVFVNSVAWLPGRNDSLLTIFILLSFISLIRYLHEPKPKYIILNSLFLALALFTKEAAISAIAVFFLYMYLFYRKELNRRIYDVLISLALPLLLWYFIRKNVVMSETSIDLLRNQLYYVQAAGKIILPFNLTVLPVLKDTSYVYGIISAVILGLLYIFTPSVNKKMFFFGVGWFIIFLFIPLLSINPEYSNDLMLESRLYLSSVGIFISLSQTEAFRRIKPALISATIYVVIIAAFSVLSFSYSNKYNGELAFWEEAVKESPSLDLSYSGLGLYFLQKENYEQAALNYMKASELNPLKAGYNSKAGFSYLKLDKTDEAEVYYRKETTVNPNDFESHFLAGVIAFKKNNFNDAEKFLLKAESINPNDAQALLYLARLYNSAGDKVKMRKYTYILKSRGIKIPEDLSGDLK